MEFIDFDNSSFQSFAASNTGIVDYEANVELKNFQISYLSN